MPHGLESDSDAPEAISMKTAKKSSKAQDKLVQDRNAQVAKLAKNKNRAQDARLKAAKEATNNRPLKSNLSSKPKRSMRKTVAVLPEHHDDHIDVERNEEEDTTDEDSTQKRIRMRMEASMRDAEGEDVEEPEGLSDADADADSGAEGLDGDFAFGEDGEPEEMSMDDEEMQDPEDEDEDEDDDEDDEAWSSDGVGVSPPARTRKRGEELPTPESRPHLRNPDYLPDELFAQAAAAITARVREPTVEKTKKTKKKRSRRMAKSKDLVIGSRTVQVAKPLNPAVMASYTVPSKQAQRFVRQHLKGGLATKGWERRPVNVGSLSVRGGPAKGFRRT